MPRSPGAPRREPIDAATLETALAGDRYAMEQVVAAIASVVSRVLATRRSDEVLEAWRYLVADGHAISRDWRGPASSSFEQHITDALIVWLDARQIGRPAGAKRRAWDPELVVTALDGGGPLERQLARDVLRILEACGGQTLRGYGDRIDAVTEAKDMAQDFAVRLFENNGALLRTWTPSKGRSFHSYIYFIGRRHFIQRARKSFKVVPLGPAIDDVEAPADDHRVATMLRRELVLEAARSQLDADERKLLELAFNGASARDGSEALGISSNNYHQRKHRLLKKIKKIMARLDDDREG